MRRSLEVCVGAGCALGAPVMCGILSPCFAWRRATMRPFSARCSMKLLSHRMSHARPWQRCLSTRGTLGSSTTGAALVISASWQRKGASPWALRGSVCMPAKSSHLATRGTRWRSWRSGLFHRFGALAGAESFLTGCWTRPGAWDSAKSNSPLGWPMFPPSGSIGESGSPCSHPMAGALA